MPTASKGGSDRGAKALSAASILGPGGQGGAGGAVAALVQQAQSQNEQMQKLIQSVMKLQQENAAQVAAAGSAGASAATEVANAVAAQVERDSRKQERQRERTEDKAFREDFARLQAKLQREANTEATAMAQNLLSQREGISRYATQFDAKRADMDESIATYSARTDEMLNAGFFDSPRGRKELAKRMHLIDMAQAFADDHFDDRHMNEAYRLHNKNVGTILEGGDPLDLTQLQVDPLLLPMPNTPVSGKHIAEQGEIDPERMFELKLLGGYPANGVVFNQEENFGLPEGYSPRLADAETMLEVLSRDDAYRVASDVSVRRQLTRKNQELIVEAFDRLEPLKDQYSSFNSTFNAMAPGSIDKALRLFLSDDNPHKFDDVGRRIVSGSIQEMFGGGTNGEKLALRAMEMFDGKAELTTPEDATVAMALESAIFNIKTHLMSEIQGAGEEGSLATQLVRQMTEAVGEEGVAQMLGTQPTAVGLVNAQDIMQQKLNESFAFANRMHQGLWSQSVLERFRKDLRKFTRMADIFAFKAQKEAGSTTTRVLEMISQDDALAQSTQGIEGGEPEDLEQLAASRSDAEIQADLGMLDGIIQLAESLGPDQLAGIAAMVTGGAESPDSPNLQAYLDNTLVERKRSGYANAAGERARFSFDRNQRARQRAKQQAQGGEPTPSVGESFKEGGAPGVVREQIPALISLMGRGALGAAAGIHRGVEGVGEGIATFAGGQSARERFQQRFKAGQNKLGAIGARILPPAGRGDISNLTEEEISGVLGEGQ